MVADHVPFSYLAKFHVSVPVNRQNVELEGESHLMKTKNMFVTTVRFGIPDILSRACIERGSRLMCAGHQ